MEALRQASTLQSSKEVSVNTGGSWSAQCLKLEGETAFGPAALGGFCLLSSLLTSLSCIKREGVVGGSGVLKLRVLLSKQHFLLKSGFHFLLLVVWTATTFSLPSVTDTAPEILIKGEVDGSVDFLCPSEKQKTVVLLYFQKGAKFVDGYYDSKKVAPAFPNRTKVDLANRKMNFRGLKVSDNGLYSCFIMYNDSTDIYKTKMELYVTANYSTPVATVECTEDSCVVTCNSHGGFPPSEVTWNVPVNAVSQQWRHGNSSKESDPASMLVNSSSTAYVNCSYGQLQAVSCSVHGATSKELTVCTSKPDGNSFTIFVSLGVPVLAILFVIVLLFLLLCWKCKRKHISCQVLGENEAASLAEMTFLNAENGEVAAS
ncbi:CD276 antigen [Lampris incognitus]|uniref:CD276 antigen n=1 Tax=Lampris incognitus TaxID=2546036 RepID=UPI0024B53430|nr:CD276 antigen [Lampris incognitus]